MPDWLKQEIDSSQNRRHEVRGRLEDGEHIEIDSDLLNELQADPYISCKYDGCNIQHRKTWEGPLPSSKEDQRKKKTGKEEEVRSDDPTCCIL